MKTRLILTIVFALAFTSAAFSQTRLISSNEFYAANSIGNKLLNENSSRVITKDETLENGSAVSSVTETHEILLPDRRSRYLTVENKKGEETSLELIYIGTMEYRRENGGQWTATDTRGIGYGSGIAVGSSSLAQFTEEPDFVEGVAAMKLKELRITQSSEGLMFSESSNWYDQRGFLLRSERTSGYLEPRTVKTRSVAIYEYNPADLKIEAPIK